MKKIGMQGLFIEDFEDKLMGLRLRGVCFKQGKKRVGPKISSVNILILNK